MVFWNPIWLSPLEPSDIKDLFHEPVIIEELYSEAITYWNQCPMDNLYDKTLTFYTKMYLQDDILSKVDRMSMMVSLEVRSPFIDRDVVEFVRRIPWQWKYRIGKTKYILKKAFQTILPKDILNRKKKGFGIPLTQWFKEDWSYWQPNECSEHIYPNQPFIQKIISDHQKGLSDNRLFLWAYIVADYCFKHA